MQKILNIFQIVISGLLIISILLQNQGAGLGTAFGGEGGSFRTKRGSEKFLFIFTIVLSAIFLGSAVANVIIF